LVAGNPIFLKDRAANGFYLEFGEIFGSDLEPGSKAGFPLGVLGVPVARDLCLQTTVAVDEHQGRQKPFRTWPQLRSFVAQNAPQDDSSLVIDALGVCGATVKAAMNRRTPN